MIAKRTIKAVDDFPVRDADVEDVGIDGALRFSKVDLEETKSFRPKVYFRSLCLQSIQHVFGWDRVNFFKRAVVTGEKH